MELPPAKQWKDFYSHHATKLGTSIMSTQVLVGRSIPDQFQIQSISNLTSEKVSVICYYSKASNSICFLHKASNLAGGVLFESKVVALSGFGEQAFPIVLGNDSISSEFEEVVPTLDSLIQMESIEDIKNLEVEDTDEDTLKSLPFMILPPFLWPTAAGIENRSPANVLLTVSTRISDHFSEIEQSVDFTLFQLQVSCKRLLQFLWLAVHSDLTPLVLIPPEGDKEISHWSEFCHLDCLQKQQRYLSPLPPAPPSHHVQNPTESIATSNLIFQNSLNQIAKLAPESNKKKGFEKLHASTRNMILQASSSDGELKAGAPCEDCVEFFQAPSHGDAKRSFIKSLRFSSNCRVNVSAGVIINLYNGNFARSYEDSPSNFSPFSFPKKPFSASNGEKESLMLQLKEMSGEGLSLSDINGALSQTLEVPKQVEYMKYNIKHFLAASRFFFSKRSILPRHLNIVLDHIESNFEVYESLQFYNKYFAAEFLFSIDTRTQLWLNQCEAAEDREEVDDSLVDFSDDLNDILRRKFKMAIPQTMKEIIDGFSEVDHSVPPPNKKKKPNQNHGNEQPSERVINKGSIQEWLADDNQHYQKAFRHNPALLNRPEWNENAKMCHRWHSKGYCFDNCSNKASHVPSDSVTQNLKDKYCSWVKPILSKK